MSRHFVFTMAILVLGALLVAGCGKEGAGNCPADQEYCDGQCVYTSSNHDHCGECGKACMPGQYCAGGDCLPCENACMPGETQCVTGNPYQFQSCVTNSDSCQEWGAPETCPGGKVCVEGQCATACEDECSRNLSQVCDPGGANGYRVCGYHDEDDCLEWGDVVECTGGTVCADGQCEGGCENECSPQGSTQCAQAGAGVESCADHDSDGCLEWGGYTACTGGDVCSNGICSDPGQCTDDCSPGQRQCSGNSYRTCGNFDADSCLDWSEYTNCGTGQTCNPETGYCETACQNECNSGDQRCALDLGAVESCADWDADGCTEWGVVMDCGAGQHCENNTCVSSCTNECDTQGERVCTTVGGDPGYETCGDHDSDPCLEYGNFIACPTGQTCSNGVCSATCEDECTTGQRRCQGNAVQLCGDNNDGDDCFDWLDPVACEAWESCSDGVCSEDCNTYNECTTEGARVCTGDNTGWQECVSDYDADPCLELGAVTTCGTNYVCENGACVLGCEDECPALNDVQCALSGSDPGTETCEDHDSDGCLEWGGFVACPTGQECSNGVCSATCTDECDFQGQIVCDGTGAFRTCGDFDADSCLDLNAATDCGYGETCQAGTGCVTVCTDECTSGQQRCSGDEGSVESCADYDSDECLEWGTLTTCGAGESCYNNACLSDDPPFTVLISEFIYDDEGTDGEYEFVELWGPAGLSLNGFSLVGVNGANGDEYLTIDLSGATLSSDTLGHLLITQDDSLLTDADVVWSSPDLQNGPDDALQVRWRGTVIVDAVAYEAGGGGNYGEGDKAPSADYSTNMYCLGRQWDNNNGTYRDSDDNATDFWKRVYCTPGWEGWMYRYGVFDTYSYGEYVDSTPAVDTATGTIFVASYNYFDAVGEDFSGLWFDSLQGFKSSPALSPDASQVYFGFVADAAGSEAGEGGLYAYATDQASYSGVKEWTWRLGTDIRSSPAVDSAGNIYVGTRAPSFAAVTSDGVQIWEESESGYVDSSPALAPVGPSTATIVVYGVGGVGSGAIVARYADTGTEVWRYPTSSGCNSSPAIGSDGAIYAACDDGVLYSLDGASGSLNWSVAVSDDLSGSSELIKGRSPVVVPDTGHDWILMTGAGDNQNFTIVDSLNGDLRDDYNYGEALSSMTALADGGFAIVWGDGNQHVLDIWGPGFDEWGWYDNLGVYDPDAWIVGSVNVEYLSSYGIGLLYVVTAEGMLYGYYLPVGLYDAAGAFPKFRSDEGNRGQRW